MSTMKTNARAIIRDKSTSGARLPPPVQPEPMVRVRADGVFDRPGELLRQILDCGMPLELRLERTFDLHHVRAVRLPHRERRDERRARAEREHRRGGRGAGLLAEEVDEDSAARAHVLIDG